jgi:hypothetical protein
LNADVNALERLQTVRGWNSSYLGSKYYVVDNIILMWCRVLCGVPPRDARKDLSITAEQRHIIVEQQSQGKRLRMPGETGSTGGEAH